LDTAKQGLRMLKEAGMKKLNFAGGEPFLYSEFLGNLCEFAKEELKLECVSIVSNGSKIKERWIKKFGKYVDILAISCDSSNEQTNIKIGRGKGRHIAQLKNVRNWCSQHSIKFKMNTVVNSFNWEEDMHELIQELGPCRWKVFQVLLLKGENDGNDALRDATQFLITDQQFQSFVGKHSDINCMVPESNLKMKNSYLILDEEMRFLNCTLNGKQPSKSIFEVGVAKAIEQSGFDEEMFVHRGGVYDWNKSIPAMQQTGCSSNLPTQLQW